MYNLLETCEKCGQVAIKDTLTQHGEQLICELCVPDPVKALLEQQGSFMDELIDCELLTAHDWNNQCPPPSARDLAEHVVIPEETWALTQQLLMDVKKALRHV